MNQDFMNGFAAGMSVKSVAFVTTGLTPWTPKINIKDARETVIFIDLLFSIPVSQPFPGVTISGDYSPTVNAIGEAVDADNAILNDGTHTESLALIEPPSWTAVTLGTTSESIGFTNI